MKKQLLLFKELYKNKSNNIKRDENDNELIEKDGYIYLYNIPHIIHFNILNK